MAAGKHSDVRVIGTTVYFLPIKTRVPLKFGHETLTEVTCCRVRVQIRDRNGHEAVGWGETPLSVQWAWPAKLAYSYRDDVMRRFSVEVAESWAQQPDWGHPLELSYDYQQHVLPDLLDALNEQLAGERMPYLAALICASATDIALHDAFGVMHDIDVYQTYTPEFLNRDLSAYLVSADPSAVSFHGRFPCDFLLTKPPSRIPVWHLVGGLDPLTRDDDFDQWHVDDVYPVVLADWIHSDGLKCLKVKLRGNDSEWDFHRLARVGEIALPLGVEHLSADFNCTVEEPAYVNEILDRLRRDHCDIFENILYVEQPFPYDLNAHRIDVRSVAERKALFLDESAHDWTYVRLGRSLGWSGVALKTCKTQSGSLLSLCWARAHGMQLMVQDLSNPMLAQIPHVRLAAHANTIMGVESNSMQFYPDASLLEARVHPGIYRRREGMLELSTIAGPGFGYRINEIARPLPSDMYAFQ